MIEIKLTESEFESLLEGNLDDYWITSVWVGKPYTTGKKPKDIEGVMRIFDIRLKKSPSTLPKGKAT